MCGIAGACGFVDEGIIKSVKAMTEAQTHRGPDGEGHWRTLPSGEKSTGCAFGFRRLAIIDLRDIAIQPMTDESNGNTIVFNGEIYNFKEIRRELQSYGIQFRTEGDSEVLLKAYGRWGQNCIKRLRGMFAFAIWDNKTRRVLIARDRFGIKPCYYTIQQKGQQKTVLFASELRALLASGQVAPVINDQAVTSYLWHGFVAGNETIIKDIELLAPGHYIEIDADTGQICNHQRYWSAPTSPRQAQRVDLEKSREILQEAVQLRLISDVPLGVFLSGGTDSSAIAASAVANNDHQINTFTIGFEESNYDESVYAERFAAHLGTNHTTRQFSQREFVDAIPSSLGMMDQPTYDGINSYLVSSYVKEAGITVALSGSGGDELFGGYDRVRNMMKLNRVAPPAIPALSSAMQKTAGHIHSMYHSSEQSIRRFLNHTKTVDTFIHGRNPVLAYQTQCGIFYGNLLNQLQTREQSEHRQYGLSEATLNAYSRELAGLPFVSAINQMELHSFLSQRILRDADSASMAVGLELRVPLLDHEFVEQLATYDTQSRYYPLGKKQLLKEIALTSEQRALIDRPKSGFTIPIQEWASDRLKPQIDDVMRDVQLCEIAGLNPKVLAKLTALNTPANAQLVWPRVWSIFVLLNWCRLHGVRNA